MAVEHSGAGAAEAAHRELQEDHRDAAGQGPAAHRGGGVRSADCRAREADEASRQEADGELPDLREVGPQGCGH